MLFTYAYEGISMRTNFDASRRGFNERIGSAR